ERQESQTVGQPALPRLRFAKVHAFADRVRTDQNAIDLQDHHSWTSNAGGIVPKSPRMVKNRYLLFQVNRQKLARFRQGGRNDARTFGPLSKIRQNWASHKTRRKVGVFWLALGAVQPFGAPCHLDGFQLPLVRLLGIVFAVGER